MYCAINARTDYIIFSLLKAKEPFVGKSHSDKYIKKSREYRWRLQRTDNQRKAERRLEMPQCGSGDFLQKVIADSLVAAPTSC